MAGEHGKETSVFLKCRAFLGELRNFEFQKNTSALWSESVSLFRRLVSYSVGQLVTWLVS